MYRIVILICVRYFTYSDVRMYDSYNKLAAMLRGSRPGMQSALLIMTSLMTS